MKKSNYNNRERINVTFDITTYNEIKLIADKQGLSMSEVVRNWTMEGLNGTLTKNNMDVLTPIIRTTLNSILNPQINRLASLAAKTCIQSGTAANLTAEAIYKFVPEEQREDVIISYEAAKKKAVRELKNVKNIHDEIEE